MPESSINTIYFDVGGTILTVRPSVGEIYAGAAARLGYELDPDVVNANFRTAWRASLARRTANGHTCDDDFLRADWQRIVFDSFGGLLPVEAAREAFEDLYDRFSRADAWELAEGAIETFEELTARGYRLGVLSNWDHRLEETLESVGIRRYFRHFVVSFDVGVEKPHPRIFEEALRRADSRPSGVLHVGDSLEWDIRPARTLGMRALWLRNGPMELSGAAEPIDGIDQIRSFGEVRGFVRGLRGPAR